MRNVILLLGFVFLLGFSIINEPIQHSIDVLAGATNTTYNTQIDQIAGATHNGGDDDDHEEYDD